MMTHKREIIPFLQQSQGAYSTLQIDDKQYHCCFGCKKHLMARDNMRIHMEGSPQCKRKHADFLTDLGLETHVSDREAALRKTIREQALEIERLKESVQEAHAGTTAAVRIESLEKELYRAERHIQLIERYFRYFPLMVKPEIVKFWEKWVAEYKAIDRLIVPSQLKIALRSRFCDQLTHCPELQTLMLPSYYYSINDSNLYNNTYQTFNNVFFDRMSYRVPEDPVGEYGRLPVTTPTLSKAELDMVLTDTME